MVNVQATLVSPKRFPAQILDILNVIKLSEHLRTLSRNGTLRKISACKVASACNEIEAFETSSDKVVKAKTVVA